jgi:ABC-type nitrate/sulfonate/bicarbonate transport system substrate-binding protein
MRRVIVFAVLVAALAGCGTSQATHDRPRDATLVLDFTPNAVHAGIYSALARGYDRGQGVHLHVIAPSASTDAIKLLETGRVDFAILDIHDLAIARERGADIVGVMAIVERPLASVIAQPAISSPRLLDDHTVGVTGAPSDDAVLESIVAGAGGEPRSLHKITIGFDAVPDLIAGRVAAATAFWNDEGVALTRQRPGFRIFKVDDYGAPRYPELVMSTTGAALRRDPALSRAVVAALIRGYQFTLSDPGASAADLERQVPGLDPALLTADLRALRPAFTATGGRAGVLDPAVLRAWARWEARFGLVPTPPDVAAMFDPSVAG